MTSLPQTPTQPSTLHVLVVDQDEAALSACVEVAASLGYEAMGIADIDRVRSTLVRLSTDILLIDLPRNDELCLETVAEIKVLYPSIAVIAMATVNSASVALAAVHCGASDYLNKPFRVEELASAL